MSDRPAVRDATRTDGSGEGTRGSDSLVRLASNASLTLTDDKASWTVEQGDVLVFAVEQVSRRPEGPRHLVASLRRGDVVTGTSVRGPEGLVLTAVGLTDSALRVQHGASAQVSSLDWADLLAGTERRVAERRIAQLARVETSPRRDEAALVDSLETLASVLPRPDAERLVVVGAAQPSKSGGFALLEAAVRLVLESSGGRRAVEQSPLRVADAALADLVRGIAGASGFRARRVHPPSQWWTTEAGPLLGILAESGRPVALLGGRSGYQLVDPATGERQPVTADVVDRLNDEVFVFTRSLPTIVHGVGQVVRLGLTTSGRDLVRLMILANVIGLAGLAVPLATKLIFGQVVPDNERGRLGALVLVLVLVAAGVAFGTTARSIAFLRVRTRFDTTAQPAVWDRLLSLPARFFTRFSIGDLLTRVQGLDYTRQLLTDTVVASTLSGVFALYSLLLLFAYETALGVIGACLTLAQVGLALALALAQLRPARQQLKAQSAAQALIMELIRGAAKLRVAGAGTRAFAVWSRRFVEQRRHAYRFGLWVSWSTVLATAWPTISILVLVVALGSLGGTQIDPGSFLSFSVAMTQVTAGVIGVGAGLSTVVQCVPYLELLEPVLTEPPEVDETRAAPGELHGEIELSHVRLRYNPEGPLVLDDLSLSVRPGQFVALVGPSGAGKSSMLRLLLGFETPESGTVSYDGKDLAGLDAGAVRRQIGTVLQSAQVIPGTIFSNIAGTTAMSRDEAWAAAEGAGLAADVRAMPMGMETVIGEGASTLSGGQRQRLLIARALGHKPRILLFDEATSALDNVTQSVVAESVAALGITRIVIAHRLSTIQDADVIYVLDAGRVVQSGDLATLSATPGPFADLAARQLA